MPTFAMPDLSGLDLSKLDLTKLDLSRVKLPKFELPKFDVPTVDLPVVDVDRLGDLVRNACYAGIGLVALTVDKATERGRGVQAEVTARARQLADAIA